MRRGISRRIFFSPAITSLPITIYYCPHSMERSPGKRQSLQPPGSRQPGLNRHSISGALYPLRIAGMHDGTKSVAFGFSPFQAQQWWAWRSLPPLPLFISALFQAINPPPISPHCPAHDYCSWIFAYLPFASHDAFFPWEALEIIRLINFSDCNSFPLRARCGSR